MEKLAMSESRCVERAAGKHSVMPALVVATLVACSMPPATQREDRHRPELPTAVLQPPGAAADHEIRMDALACVVRATVTSATQVPGGSTIQTIDSVAAGVVPLDAAGSPHAFVACRDTSVTSTAGAAAPRWEYRGQLDAGELLPRRATYAAAVRIKGTDANGTAFGPLVLYSAGTTLAGHAIPYRSRAWLAGTTTEVAAGQRPGYAMTIAIDKGAKWDGADPELARAVGGVVPVDRYGEPQGSFIAGLPAGAQTAFAAGTTDGKVPVLVRQRDLDESMTAEQWAPAIKTDITRKPAPPAAGGAAPGTPPAPTTAVVFDPDAARPLAVTEPGWGVAYGRMSYGFYLGSIVSQRDDLDFTKVTPHLRFVADTSFEANFDRAENDDYGDWDEVHTLLDIALTSTSVLQQQEGQPSAIEDRFQGTAKTLSASVGLDYRVWQFEPYDDLVLALAPAVRAGIHTVIDDTDTVFAGSAAEHWGAGLRFLGVGTRSTGEFNNPLPRHSASFYWGENELLRFPRTDGKKQSSHRLFFDAMLILEPNSGFYIGLEGNVGQGPDDVRVMFGFAGTFTGLVENLQGLVQPRLQ